MTQPPPEIQAAVAAQTEREAQAKAKIPPVRRGSHKRRARAGGMHMTHFWQLDHADRVLTHEISKVGRRR